MSHKYIYICILHNLLGLYILDQHNMTNHQGRHNQNRNKSAQDFSRKKGIFWRSETKKVPQRPRLGDEEGDGGGEESDYDESERKCP